MPREAEARPKLSPGRTSDGGEGGGAEMWKQQSFHARRSSCSRTPSLTAGPFAAAAAQSLVFSVASCSFLRRSCSSPDQTRKDRTLKT